MKRTHPLDIAAVGTMATAGSDRHSTLPSHAVAMVGMTAKAKEIHVGQFCAACSGGSQCRYSSPICWSALCSTFSRRDSSLIQMTFRQGIPQRIQLPQKLCQSYGSKIDKQERIAVGGRVITQAR